MTTSRNESGKNTFGLDFFLDGSELVLCCGFFLHSLWSASVYMGTDVLGSFVNFGSDFCRLLSLSFNLGPMQSDRFLMSSATSDESSVQTSCTRDVMIDSSILVLS